MSELAEGARLEIVCAVKNGTEGSNPSLSAKVIVLFFVYSFIFIPTLRWYHQKNDNAVLIFYTIEGRNFSQFIMCQRD